jgi:hypothetical protein
MKFSKPKMGETRFLVFMDHDKEQYWIYEVIVVKAGRTWFRGKPVRKIIDNSHDSLAVREVGEYPSFCFLETEEDSRRLLLVAALDPRSTHLFFKENPYLWELGVKANWL